LLALGACTSMPAAPTAPAPPPARPTAAAPAAAPAPTDGENAVESARRSVRSSTEWLARGVDSWFGDKPFSDGGKVSDGRLSLGLATRQHETPDLSLRLNARFRLPNVEDSTYLFLGRDDPREVITDKPGAFSRQQRLLRERAADRSFFAGLGVALHDGVDFRLGFRGGLKPYAQVRYRQHWQLASADLIDFRQTLFWTLDDHVGSTTALSYEHAFSPTLAGRWLNSATITQRARHFDWSSNLGAYQLMGPQRLLSFEALFSGVQGSGVAISDYGLQTKWQQPVYKDWLLGEVIVGHFWPRADAASPRLRAWALGGVVKMKF
ncbi:MAG: hypothetical protein Q7U26_18690, partial [Aquabacterium sp.]|nr:hypothetical protein [Aquabacterium sp.]